MTVACLKRDVDYFLMEGVCCYEVPLACADARNMEEPIRLYLCKDGNGVAWRIQGTDLPSPTKLETGNFIIENYYVRLDQNYRGTQGKKDRRLPDNQRNEYYIEFRLSPAAQECLCLNGTDLSRDWARSSTADIAFISSYGVFPNHNVGLRFSYKGTQLIHIFWQNGAFTLYGIQGYDTSKKGTYPQHDGMSTSDVRKYMERIPHFDDSHSVHISDGVTYFVLGDCCSRQLEATNYLWISSKKVPTGRWDHILVEIDVSSIDRGEIF